MNLKSLPFDFADWNLQDSLNKLFFKYPFLPLVRRLQFDKKWIQDLVSFAVAVHVTSYLRNLNTVLYIWYLRFVVIHKQRCKNELSWCTDFSVGLNCTKTIHHGRTNINRTSMGFQIMFVPQNHISCNAIMLQSC